jgi:hypothetical protein
MTSISFSGIKSHSPDSEVPANQSFHRLQAMKDEHNIAKLDHEATQSQLEKERAEAGAFKKQVESQISDIESLRKECDQNRSALLSLRTNKQAEDDRVGEELPSCDCTCMRSMLTLRTFID